MDTVEVTSNVPLVCDCKSWWLVANGATEISRLCVLTAQDGDGGNT